MTRHRVGIWAIACCLISVTACAADSGKGDEDHALTDGDGKADSFFHPTNHGTLSWGIPSHAELTEDELFHAWTFTLSDSASFSLQTDAPGALDTVMYLYHREPGADEWGHYVAKNDDYRADLATSRIELEDSPAGEYQVIVKGYKTNYRGAFQLTGTCSGDGCDGGAMCDSATFPALEPAPGYAKSCDAKLMTVLTSSITSRGGEQTVPLDQKCHLSGIEIRAVDLYQGYWDSVGGWEDATADGPPEFTVTTTRYEQGTVVSVDLAALDEDQLIATFDESETLIMFWVNGQSIDEQWYCAESGETTGDSPSCTTDLFQALPHEASEAMSVSGTTTPATADSSELGDFLGMSISEFASQFDIADDAEVEFEGAAWVNADSGMHGGSVTYRAGGHEATYTMMTTWAEHLLISSIATDGDTIIECLELM